MQLYNQTNAHAFQYVQNQKTSMLSWADYVVIGIVLVISAGIGVYYRFTGGRQKTAEVRPRRRRKPTHGPIISRSLAVNESIAQFA